MTVKELLRMTGEQVNRLPNKDLRAGLRLMVDAGNKRLRRLDDMGLTAYANAYQEIFRGEELKDIHFVTRRNWTRKQIMNTWITLREFLSDTTTTVRGARKLKKSVEELADSWDWTTAQFNVVYNGFKKEADRKAFAVNSRILAQAIDNFTKLGVYPYTLTYDEIKEEYLRVAAEERERYSWYES